jgi:hypothetical protein
MQFIIVRPEGILSSPQRAQFITRELYCITLPLQFQSPDQHDGTVFGVIHHPTDGRAALQVDLDYVIPVHPLVTLERLVSLFPEITERLVSLFPEITDAERMTLMQVIFSVKAFPFRHIVPSTVTVRDEAFMIADGWFPAEP